MPYTQKQILDARGDRAKLVAQAQAIDVTTGTTEDRARFDTIMDDADLAMQNIERMERALKTDAENRGATAPPADAIILPGADDPEVLKKAQARHHRAWSNAMKYGLVSKPTANGGRIKGVSKEDLAILTGDSTDGFNAEMRGMEFKENRDMAGGGQGAYPGATTGFFIPVGFTNRVEDALKFYGPMLNGGPGNPDIFDTATGQILPFPTENDTAVVGELIGEGQQVTSQDVSLNQITLSAYKYSTKLVKVSIELLQDSAFDLESFLVKLFAIRLGRILNTHFTTGTGTNQPQGIVTAAVSGAVAVGSSSNDGTAASTNTIGSDDLINLEHSVDILYRPGAKYMMNDTTLRALKQVKDKYGRPLWLPGLAVAAPDTINSYSYLINNDMDALQASGPNSPPTVKKSVLFGQLSKYMIRRVKDMSVLRLEERFADYGQVAFLAFARYDGKLLDAGTNPVKYLSNTY